MSKIQRYDGNFPPFARDFQSQERTSFGTEDVGVDSLTDNINSFWLRGWGIISPSEFPPIQYFNALGFTLSQSLAYLHQQGMPEWNASQEYFTNSVVQKGGSIYIAQTGTDGSPNVGNDPAADDGTNWLQMPDGKSVRVEKATDGGADAFVSAVNTGAPAGDHTTRRDFQSANDTETPTLDGRAVTTRDGSPLWPGALFGVHALQYRSGSDTYRVLNPRQESPRSNGSVALVFATAGVRNTAGATGDGDGAGGGTDDTAALQALVDVINAGGGGTLDLEGHTYRVDSTLVVKSYVWVRNGSIDFSSAADGDKLLETQHSSLASLMQDTESLTASATTGDTSLTVADSSAFSADEYVWIESNEAWSNSGATRGEMARITNVPDANTINLREPLIDTYGTGNAATVARVDWTQGVGFERVSFQSNGTANQTGGELRGARDAAFVDCQWFDFDERAIRLSRSIHYSFTRCKFAKSRKTGFAYGITQGEGCHWGTVSQCYFEDQRHGWTTGGSAGPNRYLIVANCTFYGQFDSGWDSHDASQFLICEGNTITCTSEATGAKDGIVVQGIDTTVRNNTIRWPQRHGILCQPAAHLGGYLVISGNVLIGDGVNSDIGIFIETKNADIGVSVNDNKMNNNGFNQGINLSADAGYILHSTVASNSIDTVRGGRGIYLQNTAGVNIQYFAITGNEARAASTSDSVIHMLGATEHDMRHGVVSGNLTYGGDHGIRAVNGRNLNVAANTVIAANATPGIDLSGLDVQEVANLVT